MTATTKLPGRERRPRQHQIRFSSMESLGFSNPSATWTDSPVALAGATVDRRGRHEAPQPEPDTVADWVPEEIGGRLTGRDIRWSIVVLALLVLCGIGGLGYYIYQRPVAQTEASLATLSARAESLLEILPTLDDFRVSLTADEPANSTELFAVDEAARALFDASGLSGANSRLQSSASAAATSALDAVRLAGDASSYRLAVAPILLAPDLVTDPNLIELDEAARSFGEWQLRFDEVRTALPEQTMTTTTQQLDILSGDLPAILTDYMDALRQDDQSLATGVLIDLSSRLSAIRQRMAMSIEEIQTKVTDRIADTEASIEIVLGG